MPQIRLFCQPIVLESCFSVCSKASKIFLQLLINYFEMLTLSSTLSQLHASEIGLLRTNTTLFSSILCFLILGHRRTMAEHLNGSGKTSKISIINWSCDKELHYGRLVFSGVDNLRYLIFLTLKLHDVRLRILKHVPLFEASERISAQVMSLWSRLIKN